MDSHLVSVKNYQKVGVAEGGWGLVYSRGVGSVVICGDSFG